MKKFAVIILSLFLILSLAACSAGAEQPVDTSSLGSAATPASESGLLSSGSTEVEESSQQSVAAALAENQTTHDDPDDYTWASTEVIPIALNGDAIEADHDGVTFDGATLTITKAGIYSLSGRLTDGQVIVDTQDEAVVRLILNGVEISSAIGSAVQVLAAEKVVIVLADGTTNRISDGSEYTFADAETDEPNAAVFCAADLTIAGAGALMVEGNYNDGIASKDGLIIAGGKIEVTAVDDGIRGKDYLVIGDANVVVAAGGDGLKADNEEEAERGYVVIESGSVEIEADGDGIDAATDVIVSGGEISVSSGGRASFVGESSSAKGIVGSSSVMIVGGVFNIDAADDAVHSNGSITVSAGEMEIASGDDGMHADEALTISGGAIRIADCYEGLESAVITIDAGDIQIHASDDGINVAGGADGSGMPPGDRQRPGGMGAPGQDAFTANGNYYLTINGGVILVDAGGDGLDVNGAITMTDGVVLINGPTENMNGALDYMSGFELTGGTLVAVGSAGMAMAPDQSSSQYSILVNFNSMRPSGTIIHIQDSAGENVLTFEPTKSFQSIEFSSPQLASGETYQIYLGGSASGNSLGGLYLNGVSNPGSQYAEIEISGVVTTLGGSGMMGGGPPGPPRNRP